MKISITLITIFLLATGRLQAQTKQQIDNLATFAKVWGFLKYYHPAVAKDTANWDKQWLNSVLTIKKITDSESFNQFIIKFLSQLPKQKIDNRFNQPAGDSILHVFDEREIKRYNIPGEFKQEMVQLYLHHSPDSSNYLDNRYGKYILDYVYFKEDPYTSPVYPDEAHRLLGLARYWNIINYFYPHKPEMARNWDKVLIDFIPQFINAANADEYHRAFFKLTAHIKDSHSFFTQAKWNEGHLQNPPFLVYYINGKYVVGNDQYADLMTASGFKAGDEIVAVNNRAIADCVKYLTPYCTGSNNASFQREIGRNLFRRDTGNSVQLSVMRNGKTISNRLKLYSYAELYQYRLKHQPKIWENLGNGIFYVRFCKITNNKQLKDMLLAIQRAKAVIWEMRDYPYYPTVQAVWPGLQAKRTANETNYNAMLFYPGAYKASIDQIASAPDTLNLPLYKGKLIVLVNEFTQSLAESVCAELYNRPNTLIMGRQTAGATGNLLRNDFPGGIEVSYTAVKTVGLNGSFKQGKGVRLDKKIDMNINKMQTIPDYELQQAYEEALKDNLK